MPYDVILVLKIAFAILYVRSVRTCTVMQIKFVDVYLLDFTFMEIKTEVIIDNLLKLNPKKATGHDGLSPKILKLSTAALATPLTNLFNYCIRTKVLFQVIGK